MHPHPGTTQPPDAVPQGSLALAEQLSDLREAIPDYSFWQEITGDRVRYVALRRHPGTRPHTVVTEDPAELPALLGRNLVPEHHDGEADPDDELPQAVADDYPGWDVRREQGAWTAWCPAITLRAATADDLRVAIEHAIAGDDD